MESGDLGSAGGVCDPRWRKTAVIGQFLHEPTAQQSAGEGRAKSARPSAKR